MLEKILNAFTTVLKSGETKKFAEQSVENIAKVCIMGDVESGVREAVETGKYIGSIKDVLFWGKIKKWLEKTYASSEVEAKISSKFTEDEPKYREYTKRQIQFIAQVDEEEKIDFYANLTRAWLLGYIDSSLYFKMSYLLKIFTLEELEYLKENYDTNSITDINYYIREFSLYGLVDVVENTNVGHSTYKYSDLAEAFVSCGLLFNDGKKIPFIMKGLQDLKVENTRTCQELVIF